MTRTMRENTSTRHLSKTASTLISVPNPLEHVNVQSKTRTAAAAASWGRTGRGRRSWLSSLVASLPVVLAPLTSATTFIVLTGPYDGSFSRYLSAVAEEGFWSVYGQHGPRLTLKAAMAVICWVAWQALLFRFLPGTMKKGQRTPAGHVLTYKMNGLYAWVLTHLAYFCLGWLGFIDLAFIPHNWSGLVAALNLAGLLVSAFAFVKAYVAPTHPEDRKFSGVFLSLSLSTSPPLSLYYTLCYILSSLMKQ